MNTTRIPGFSAEASLHFSSTRYQANVTRHGRWQGREALVNPAARYYPHGKVFHCGMKGCFLDLRDLGFPLIFCDYDGKCR